MKQITVDYLSEKEMQVIRDLLDSLPNREHHGVERDERGRHDVFYGDYVRVRADVQGDVLTKSFAYHNVAFDIHPKYTSKYAQKRNEERARVIGGLAKILSDFVTQS